MKARILLLLLAVISGSIACNSEEAAPTPTVTAIQNPTPSVFPTSMPSPSETYKSGLITEDETWSGIVHITGDVVMRDGHTLTILPGTKILFAAHQDDQHSGSAVPLDEYIAQHNDPTWTLEYAQSHSAMTVYGKLIAKGTPENAIVFTSDSPAPDAGDWLQVHIGSDSIIEYCIIEYARVGLDIMEGTGESVFIDHNLMRHILWCSISVHSSSPTISNNEIFHAGGHGGIVVLGEKSRPLITNNTIKECMGGMGILEGSSAVVEHNTFVDNDAVAVGIGESRAGDSTILRYNSISCPKGPSMHMTYRGEIIYPSHILLGEPGTVDGIRIDESSPTISNNEIFQCDYAGINIFGESSPIITTTPSVRIGWVLYSRSLSPAPQ